MKEKVYHEMLIWIWYIAAMLQNTAHLYNLLISVIHLLYSYCKRDTATVNIFIYLCLMLV